MFSIPVNSKHISNSVLATLKAPLNFVQYEEQLGKGRQANAEVEEGFRRLSDGTGTRIRLEGNGHGQQVAQGRKESPVSRAHREEKDERESIALVLIPPLCLNGKKKLVAS